MEDHTYDIPMDMNYVEGAYEIPEDINNSKGTSKNNIPLNIQKVDAKMNGVTNQTVYMKKRTDLIIYLVLTIVFVGVCVGAYFAGKAAAQCKDDETGLPNVAATTTVTKASTQSIKVTRPSTKSVTCPTPECPNLTCPTPECPSITCATPECPSITCPTPEYPVLTCPTPECQSITCPTPECPSITCPTPECPSNTFHTPESLNTTCPAPECSTTTCLRTPENSRCLDGWVTHGVSCYFFGNDSYKHLSEAESFCRGLNGKLIEVDTDSENQFVKDYLSTQVPDFYWMGLTDMTTEGKFLLYSSNKSASFFDWANGEPNNKGNEDCVAFDMGHNYSWNDIPCDRFSYIPICEL